MFDDSGSLRWHKPPPAPVNLFVVPSTRADDVLLHGDDGSHWRVPANTLAWWNGEAHAAADDETDPVLRDYLEMAGLTLYRVRVDGVWAWVEGSYLASAPAPPW